MITFAIVAFNQRNEIVRALESVRYQIEIYGNNQVFQLIISNDASSDDTLIIAEKWLKINRKLFYDVEIINARENRGTCKCIAEIYRKIRGEHFFCFAADDAIAQNNIIEYLFNLEKQDIIISYNATFSNGKLSTHICDYKNQLLRRYISARDLRYTSIAMVPVDGPSMAFKKEFLDEQLINYISKYDLIEDRPTVYGVVNTHPNAKVSFIPHVYMLYQISASSVSHISKRSTVAKRANCDLVAFYEDVLSKEKKVGYRYIAYCNKEKFLGKKLFKYINISTWYVVFMKLKYKSKMKRDYFNLLSEFELCQKHLSLLETRKREFMNDGREQ